MGKTEHLITRLLYVTVLGSTTSHSVASAMHHKMCFNSLANIHWKRRAHQQLIYMCDDNSILYLFHWTLNGQLHQLNRSLASNDVVPGGAVRSTGHHLTFLQRHSTLRQFLTTGCLVQRHDVMKGGSDSGFWICNGGRPELPDASGELSSWPGAWRHRQMLVRPLAAELLRFQNFVTSFRANG